VLYSGLVLLHCQSFCRCSIGLELETHDYSVVSPLCLSSSSKSFGLSSVHFDPQTDKLALAHIGPPNFKRTNLILEQVFLDSNIVRDLGRTSS